MGRIGEALGPLGYPLPALRGRPLPLGEAEYQVTSPGGRGDIPTR